MKWLVIAALTLALLFGRVFLVINKQEQLSVITNEVQTYMGQRDTLQKEVGNLQGHRDRRAALDKEWEEFKTKEGELKGKYGEKLMLEGECSKLTEKREGLLKSIETYEELVASLKKRASELAIQTNALVKAMDRIRGNRDMILEDIERIKKDRDKFESLRNEEKDHYTNQKRLADQESARADSEKKRANEAKIAADDAERRRGDAESAAKAAETAQKARVAALRAETDKEIAEQEKHKSAARKAAGAATAKAEAEEAKLNTLAAEVAKFEARRDELAGVEKQLAETKDVLAEEQAKLGQTRAKFSAQQIAAQIDGVREEVSRRLGAFGAKLDELEKKQNAEVKQGGLK